MPLRWPITRIFAVALLSFPIWAAGPVAAEVFTTEAKHAFLYDVTTDSVLFAKEPDVTFPPASLAKLMTLDVVFDALERGRITPDQTMVVSENAWRTGGAPARVSAMFAKVTSHVSVRDLVRGVAVVVGNDAAIALAEGIAGNETAFAAEMNARARDIGLKSSRFVNATGLPAVGQKTTAHDLARLASHLAAAYPDLYRVFSEPELDWNKIKQRNRNPLLAAMPGSDGLMVGAVEGFGHILVGSAVRDGKRLVVVVAGLESDQQRVEASRALLDWGFSGFVERELFARDAIVAEASVFGGTQGRVPLVAPDAVRIPMPRDGDSRVVARVLYDGPVIAPVTKGESIGVLKIWRDGLLQREVPLAAAVDISQGTLWQRALDASYELAVAAVNKLIDRL